MSASTDPGNKSAAEIEREVEATRARLTGTIEDLKERVSPGQIFEQALDYVKGSGGQEFVSNLGTSVRDNPLPVVLIGAGIAWMMMSSGRDRSRDYEPAQRLLPAPRRTASVYAGPYDRDDERPNGPSLGQRIGETASSYGRSIGDTASSYGQSVGDAASSLRDRAGDAADYARDAASAARERVGETAASLRDRAGDAAATVRDAAGNIVEQASDAYYAARDTVADAANRAGEAVSDAWRGMKERTRDMGDRAYRMAGDGYDNAPDIGEGLNRLMREQPLLVGGLGLVIGAAIGAALPNSDAEDRLMGETRDELAAKARALAAEGYQQAKDVAGEHLGKVQEAAVDAFGRVREDISANGLSPQRGAEALTQVAREVREAVEKTARDVAGQARDAASGSDKPQA